MTDVKILLDETDRRRRLLQHGSVLVGVMLLVLAFVLANKPGTLPRVFTAIGAGLALFSVAAGVDQRWEVTHKGHQIRFQNNPFRGEKLFIDNQLVGRGRLGYRSEIRASIQNGEGIGDRVVARSEAGLTTFSCRIFVEPAQQALDVVNGMSNEELLAEVRRRGLSRREES